MRRYIDWSYIRGSIAGICMMGYILSYASTDSIVSYFQAHPNDHQRWFWLNGLGLIQAWQALDRGDKKCDRRVTLIVKSGNPVFLTIDKKELKPE